MKKVLVSVAAVLATASIAMAGANVGVDVATPNVRVQVGTSQPPPVTVVQRETVVVKEVRKDNGKHKGHHKKHKKHKKHDD